MEWKFYSVCWREAHRTGLSYKNCLFTQMDEWHFCVVIKLELLAISTVGLVMIGQDVILDVFLHFAKWVKICRVEFKVKYVFLMLK